MKQKIEKLLMNLFKDRLWLIVVSGMVLLLTFGFVYYAINYIKPGRQEVQITKKEFNNNKINTDLSETDEVESSASFEDYNAKLAVLKAKLPKAEWKLTERELSKEAYDAAMKKYYEDVEKMNTSAGYYYMMTGEMPTYSSGDIPMPERIEYFPYSMKGFLNGLYENQEIDSTDFDAKIAVLDKVEHFLSLSDKKGGDTLLVDKFQGVLSNSKDLSMEEIEAIEKLHNSITKTKLVFSLTKENSPAERQEELFNFYQSGANSELTAEVFEELTNLSKHLKEKSKIKDTAIILNVIGSAMNLDFSNIKGKEETSKDLEISCIQDFFFKDKFKYNAKDVSDKFSKHISLYQQKLEAANLERKAREILREENRSKALDWMYFGFFFTCFTTLIVLMIKMNSSLKTQKNN